METQKKGLFVVLDGLTNRRGLEGALKDFRALGYRVIGILVGNSPGRRTVDFQFDEIVQVDRTEWEFPSFAWGVARRFSINVRRSLLCSADLSHERWAHNAGLRRFETPEILFGI